MDGILHLDIKEQSFTGDTFKEFISGLLDNMNPYPEKNSVIIMDNGSIHHVQGVREMIEGR